MGHPPQPLDRRTELLGYGACAIAGSLWGTGFYFGRLALNEMSVEWMVLYRYAFACLGLLPLLFRQRVRFTAGEWSTLLLSSFLGIPVQFLMQFHGLAMTTVSHASLMVGTLPVLLAIASVWFADENMKWLNWLALVGSTGGVALIVLGGNRGAHGASLRGDLLILVSLFISVFWIMLNKKLMTRHSPVVVTTYCILAGTAMLVAWVVTPWLLSRAPAPPVAAVSVTAWLALAASGLLCTTTTTLLWNWGIHHVPTSRAGIFLNMEPVVGSLLGVTLLGEVMGSLAWVGGGLIIAAAVVMTMRGGELEGILE